MRARSPATCRARSVCSSASITRWPKRSANSTKSPSGSTMVCCTQGALCSRSLRNRWDLPEPELPCTRSRVASSSSRSRATVAPAVVCPISIATVMSQLKAFLRRGLINLNTVSRASGFVCMSDAVARRMAKSSRHQRAGLITGRPRSEATISLKTIGKQLQRRKNN